MRIVHFTEAATDPLKGVSMFGARFVSLADGAGEDETFVSCLHLEPGGWISDPPTDRDNTLLVVHGAVRLTSSTHTPRVRMSCGMGSVRSAGTRYTLDSESGAILLVVEAERLKATDSGVSTPERIMGAVWPGEPYYPRRRTLLSLLRRVYSRWKWRKVNRSVRTDRSGWRPKPNRDTVVAAVLDLLGRERE